MNFAMKQFLNPLTILELDGNDRAELRKAIKRKTLEFEVEDGTQSFLIGKADRKKTHSITKAEFSNAASEMLDSSDLLRSYQRLLDWPELEWFLVARVNDVFHRRMQRHHRELLNDPGLRELVSSRFATQYGLELESYLTGGNGSIEDFERVCSFTPVVLDRHLDDTYAPAKRILKSHIECLIAEIDELDALDSGIAFRGDSIECSSCRREYRVALVLDGETKVQCNLCGSHQEIEPADFNYTYYRKFFRHLIQPRTVNALPSFLDGDLNQLARRVINLSVHVYNTMGDAKCAHYITQIADQIRTSGRDKAFVKEKCEEISAIWHEAKLHALHAKELEHWGGILRSIKALIESIDEAEQALSSQTAPVSVSQIVSLNDLPFIFDDVRNSLCWGLLNLSGRGITSVADIVYGLDLLKIASTISVTDYETSDALWDRKKALNEYKDRVDKKEQEFLVSTTTLLTNIKLGIEMHGIRSTRTDMIEATLSEIFCSKHIQNLASSKNRESVNRLIEHYTYVLQCLHPDIALAHYNRLEPLRNDKGRIEFLNVFHAHTLKRKRKSDGCFIATACYRDQACDEVLLFRRFRDEVLSEFLIGRIFINSYYVFSPVLAALLRRTPTASFMVRLVLLNPIYRYLRRGRTREI